MAHIPKVAVRYQMINTSPPIPPWWDDVSIAYDGACAPCSQPRRDGSSDMLMLAVGDYYNYDNSASVYTFPEGYCRNGDSCSIQNYVQSQGGYNLTFSVSSAGMVARLENICRDPADKTTKFATAAGYMVITNQTIGASKTLTWEVNLYTTCSGTGGELGPGF